MKTKKGLSVILSVLMLGSLIPARAGAVSGADPRLTPEWAVDDGASGSAPAALQQALPARYDLRDEGLVTPVKLQNPWGSCWAFGAIAAAESSILSAYGTTYEESRLDLSERHLACFALRPVSADADPAQAGEGMYTFDPSPNAAFEAGGSSIYVTTLFSQGVGPVQESMFPYRGSRSMTALEYFDAHADEVTRAQLEAELAERGITVDTFLENQARNAGITVEEAFAYYKNLIRGFCESVPEYSSHDDWSIPETDEAGDSNRLLSSGVLLKDGNVLPEYWSKGQELPNADSLHAIRQELLNGRGVSISYHADQSGNYTMTSEEKGEKYCQYIDREELDANHTVCVVGWDDGYAAENFKTPPPGSGAWIVKNSWGSTADAGPDDLGNVVNRNKYGAKDAQGEYTGCFWLSYYDKSICQPETMEFTSNLGGGGSFYTLQYDYMPARGGFFTIRSPGEVLSSANVFETDIPLALKSLSTRTSEENMRVTFSVYLLEDGAKDPADGLLLIRTSRNFEYAGFHRVDLDQPLRIEGGRRFSVVSTASKLSNEGKRVYSASANMAYSKETAEHYHLRSYSKAVVNEGESYLYSEGRWIDWSAFLKEHAEAVQGEPVDNFPIKVYAEPVEEPAAAAVSVSGAVNGSEVIYHIPDAPAGAKLIAARYDDGQMTDMKLVDAPDTLGALSLEGSGATFRLLMVDGESLTPLCPAWESPA